MKSEHSLNEYCKDVRLYVGHNIDGFEAKFLPWLFNSENRTFDIMLENVNILRLEPEDYSYCDNWKWRTLKEIADFYEVRIPMDCAQSGMTSVKMVVEILQKMLVLSGLRCILLSP